MQLTVLLSQKATLFLILLINFSSFTSSENQAKYVGCFQVNRTIQSFIVRELTPEQCLSECFKSGAYYAGIRTGGVCECYEEDPTDNNQLPESRCSVMCENGYHCDKGSVYHTDPQSVGRFDHTLGFLGCYAAQAVTALLNGFVTSQRSMTPHVCVSLCQSKGFMYAGLLSSDQCLCGNHEPHYDKRLPPTRCNQRCAGDIRLVCGGFTEVTVYMTGITVHINGIDQTLALVGCYLTRGTSIKEYVHYNHLGPQQCIQNCAQNNNLFAHLFDGAYCYCSNASPIPYDKRHLTECSTPCVGDPKYVCGGPTTHLVYRTAVTVHAPGVAYMGCYQDGLDRRLQGKKTISHDMTPSMCIGTCTELGFAFAGVQFSYQCFCGNEIPLPEDKRPEGECNRPCKGNSSQICGAVWRNSIFKTMHKAPGYDRLLNYYGCHEDKPIRKLKGYYYSKSTMTPNLCVSMCKLKTYVYAGVQNGNQCFCGNETPLPKDRQPESECKKSCAGNPRFICGGWYRNSIYKT